MLTQGHILKNRYRIVKPLGQGGFGAVYRAWDIDLDKPCAVKENLDSSQDAQTQFLLEAKLLANLHHTHLPRVTDHFLLPQGQYLIMDFVEGEDLQSKLDAAKQALSEHEVITWARQVLFALNYLHLLNPPVIHRDIKPANIIITTSNTAMLVDFGIAKNLRPSVPTVTAARAVTLGYSPPEQYGSGPTDARSDIYALGATLYHLLTNQLPVESIQRTLGASLSSPRALNSGLSLRTEQAILRAIEVAPLARFQSATEFQHALSSPVYVHPTPTQIVSGSQSIPASLNISARWNVLATGLSLLAVFAIVIVAIVATVIASLLLINSDDSAAAPTTHSIPSTIPDPVLSVTPIVVVVTATPGATVETALIDPPAEPTTPPPQPTTQKSQFSCPLASSGGVVYSSARDFSNSQGGNFELYAINFSDPNPQRLTRNSVYDGSPNVSPGGTLIAFESYFSGNSDIFIINSNGSGPTQLTSSATDDFVPVWSPNGAKIAFYTNRDGNYEVYMMNADGSNQINLTNNPADDRLPTWSPDGQFIAFASDRSGNFDVFAMTSDGRDPVQLTSSFASDRDPAWSPVSNQIAFETDRDGNFEIYLMNSDGSQLMNLSQNPSGDSTAAWSVDGTRISFESTRDGNTEVYAMNGDGSCQTRLTFSPRTDNYAAWSP